MIPVKFIYDKLSWELISFEEKSNFPITTSNIFIEINVTTHCSLKLIQLFKIELYIFFNKNSENIESFTFEFFHNYQNKKLTNLEITCYLVFLMLNLLQSLTNSVEYAPQTSN